MRFLATCTSLRQLVLTRPDGIGFDAWAELSRNDRTTLADGMTECYGCLTRQAIKELDVLGARLDGAVALLRRIIFDDLEVVIHHDWMG